METFLTSNISAKDGALLKVARFEPAGGIRGIIQIVHGFGEHIERYRTISEALSGSGFACVINDLRGHGEMPWLSASERKKSLGITPGYESYLDDITAVREQISNWYPNTPVYLYGHSMGGNIALAYLMKRKAEDFKAGIMENPWLRLYKPKPQAAVLLARFLGALSPNIAVYNKIQRELITSDKAVQTSLNNDTLYHNRISLRIFASVTDTGEWLIKNADKLKIPVLMLCGSRDRLCSPSATREFSNKAGAMVRLIEYPNSLHVIRRDCEKDKMLQDFTEYLLQ